MISRATRSFWQAYEQFNPAQKRAARRVFALFLENPGHNSLQFKKLRGYSDYWSVRVSRDIRAVGKRAGDTIESARTTTSTNSSDEYCFPPHWMTVFRLRKGAWLQKSFMLSTIPADHRSPITDHESPAPLALLRFRPLFSSPPFS
ncbi:MAG: hypothetical protein DMF20_10470 [Verrucomicrobia bacterium]|nr:MAG: hypothetical protein DME48_11630 [Verrucomicrobiota bacterium]PYL64508.1 MAG: hypothetical protein DMF20_10470 [Verrucomicrobiota bacterium]